MCESNTPEMGLTHLPPVLKTGRITGPHALPRYFNVADRFGDLGWSRFAAFVLHSGVSGAAGAVVSATGRLGLSFDRIEYEDHGRFKVAEVVYRGPADLTGAIHVGDFLTAIDGKGSTPALSIASRR